jgi:hypothetical protein
MRLKTLTTQHDAKKREAERLLALRAKHKNSARVCSECGEQPLSLKDPLGAVKLADPETGDVCPGCKAILGGVEAFYVVTMPPRGTLSCLPAVPMGKRARLQGPAPLWECGERNRGAG